MALALDKVSAVRQYLYSKQHLPSVRIAVLGCEGVGKRSLLQRVSRFRDQFRCCN